MAPLDRTSPVEFDEVVASSPSPLGLFLGNGFSIACKKSFDYHRLLDEAEFGSPAQVRRVRRMFESANTADFEAVIRRFEEAAETADLYRTAGRLPSKMRGDAEAVRRGLAGAVAAVHPSRISDVGDGSLDQCNSFLRGFNSIFTINYDLLLYWAVNRNTSGLDDGFRKPQGELVHAEPDLQNVYWLHGALHLSEVEREDASFDTVKASWAGGGPIIDQVREAIQRGGYPLVVAEGSAAQKLRTIQASDYLAHCLDSLRGLDGTLVTFGWGMNPNDVHIRQAIIDSAITQVWIGVRPGETGRARAQLRAAADLMEADSAKGLAVGLWDTGSAAVW